MRHDAIFSYYIVAFFYINKTIVSVQLSGGINQNERQGTAISEPARFLTKLSLVLSVDIQVRLCFHTIGAIKGSSCLHTPFALFYFHEVLD